MPGSNDKKGCGCLIAAVVAVVVLSVPLMLSVVLRFVSPIIGDRAGERIDVDTPGGPKIKFTMQNGTSFQITTNSKWSPRSVKHFIDLVRSGFYDKKPLYRVESEVVRWGPPLKKTDSIKNVIGTRASGYDGNFNEFDIAWDKGYVGVACDESNNGADFQLFVVKKPEFLYFDDGLDYITAIVGRVTEGMDVVDGIKKGDKVRTARVLP